ncbi:MAG: hypothetical protein VX265_04440 [Myxococcota bacterium]|nr:hypothetical protein [Myxococcota bacterium]
MTKHGAELLARVVAAVGDDWWRVRAVAEVAAARGEPLWLVGGAVRDLLLDRPVEDVDLMVEGDAVALAAAVRSVHGGTVIPHGTFGTAKWTPGGGGAALDIAAARSERYPVPGGLPVVASADVRKDLMRRDFTINAMAIRLTGDAAGTLLDPMGGGQDLEAGLLRVLHPDSFADDPTRAFRAARFAGRFGFRLAERTAAWLEAAVTGGALAALGLERLGAELDRLLRETAVLASLRAVAEWGLASGWHPPLFRSEAIEMRRLERARRTCAEAAVWAPDLQIDCTALRWMVLVARVDPAVRARSVCMVPGGRAAQRRFRSGLDEAVSAGRALDGARRGVAGHVFRELDPTTQLAVFVCAERDDPTLLRWWLEEGRHVTLGIDGRQLIDAGVPGGPLVGRGLRAAWSAAWEGADAEGQRAAAMAAVGA